MTDGRMCSRRQGHVNTMFWLSVGSSVWSHQYENKPECWFSVHIVHSISHFVPLKSFRKKSFSIFFKKSQTRPRSKRFDMKVIQLTVMTVHVPPALQQSKAYFFDGSWCEIWRHFILSVALLITPLCPFYFVWWEVRASSVVFVLNDSWLQFTGKWSSTDTEKLKISRASQYCEENLKVVWKREENCIGGYM